MVYLFAGLHLCTRFSSMVTFWLLLTMCFTVDVYTSEIRNSHVAVQHNSYESDINLKTLQNNVENNDISPTKDATVESTTNEGWNCEQLDYCTDKLGFEAIQWLHRQLDDDDNGNVDIAESNEFLRDELKYENGHDRQKAFHGNDKHISVDDLWRSWKLSEVHNWTVEQTAEWLSSNVELPQYAELFINHGVDGTVLPRLASNSQYASSLGIRDPIHRQKVALKAMDIVLFGQPKQHNFVKDVILALSLVIACGGCWFAFVQHKRSQIHVRKMLQDMEQLQKAEDQLMTLQSQLDKAQQEAIKVGSEKKSLEEKLKATESFDKTNGFAKENSLPNISEFSKVYELEAELAKLREQLMHAECSLKSKSWLPPSKLQQWLKVTYDKESSNIEVKRRLAVHQMESAKRACDKLNRTRSSLLGSFRVAHGSVIDEVDRQLLEAKASLSTLITDIQECTIRWREIQLLCGFPIVDTTVTVTSANSSPTSQLTRNNSDCSLDSESSLHIPFVTDNCSFVKTDKRGSKRSMLSFRLTASKSNKSLSSVGKSTSIDH